MWAFGSRITRATLGREPQLPRGRTRHMRHVLDTVRSAVAGAPAESPMAPLTGYRSSAWPSTATNGGKST